MPKELDRWTPIRRGAVYCSPSCGRGCTYAAFREAEKDAAALAKKLGPGWRAHVWENLGWHYAAIYDIHDEMSKTRCIVYPTVAGRYHAYLGPWVGEHTKTPKAAVRSVLTRAKDEQARVNQLVNIATASISLR